ncbi:MAG TPA: aspartate aminotransferase family protein [Geobacterales bacterium]|nr:aspartate aminotransferase family protein [Geobacterales bacterium]
MQDIEKILADAAKLDSLNVGKLFAYIYETGDEELKKIAFNALIRFYDKNMLDFSVYRSSIFFEKELIKFCNELMHGPKQCGTFTYGGTESIMLAVLAGRNRFIKRKGKDKAPELLLPFTIHPAFLKAAHYLGLKVKIFGIDKEMRANIEEMKELLNEDTALIALSAPNWPYGTIDPIREAAEIANEKGILLHVDACVGGFILPFFEKLGLNNKIFDFRIDGVTSISLDVHKYGYAPKGASVLLFREEELKKESIFVNVSNPGYIFINSAVLSSRSVGPLAAAYATIKYLGEKGYTEFAKQVAYARDKIYHGMRKLNFKEVAPIESPILSLYSEDIDLAAFMLAMRKLGWHFHLQRAIKKFNIPTNLHMTISPVHSKTCDEFLIDAKKALEMKKEFDLKKIDMEQLIGYIKEGKIDSSIAPLLIDAFDEETAIDIVKNLVIDWYR